MICQHLWVNMFRPCLKSVSLTLKSQTSQFISWSVCWFGRYLVCPNHYNNMSSFHINNTFISIVNLQPSVAFGACVQIFSRFLTFRNITRSNGTWLSNCHSARFVHCHLPASHGSPPWPGGCQGHWWPLKGSNPFLRFGCPWKLVTIVGKLVYNPV